jgi:hypothetical protein
VQAGDRPFLGRRDRIEAIDRPERWHPFSHDTTTLRDQDFEILTDCFDLRVRAPRGCHVAFGPSGEAAGLAIGYVRGLREVRRTAVRVATETVLAEADRERLPVIVLEALLRIVPPPGDEIMLDEVVELILRLRDGTGLPIRWVTTSDALSWVGPLLALRQNGFQTGELSADDRQPSYAALKSAIYDRRLETYHYGPLVEQLNALEWDDTGRVRHAGSTRSTRGSGSGREMADAAAGVVHLLVRRRDSWTAAMEMVDDERPSLGPRPSIPRPTFDRKTPDQVATKSHIRQPGRIRVRSEEWEPWW